MDESTIEKIIDKCDIYLWNIAHDWAGISHDKSRAKAEELAGHLMKIVKEKEIVLRRQLAPGEHCSFDGCGEVATNISFHDDHFKVRELVPTCDSHDYDMVGHNHEYYHYCPNCGCCFGIG